MNTGLRLLLLAAAWLAACPAAAQPLAGGRLEFRYRQFPFGPYTGAFRAEGSVVDFASFPPSSPGAVHAARFVHGGLHTILVVGGFGNGDDSADLSFLLLRSDQPFTPGIYVVDPVTFSVTFGFLDDARGVQIPSEPWTADWQLVLDAIVARHKFGAISGMITLDVVDSNRVAGTFRGFMVEDGGGVTITLSDASFSVGLVVTPVEPVSWGGIKAAYRR
jgi:hypothetical protein